MNEENKIQAANWAIEQMPREACGVVIIERGRESFVPCRNISELDDAFIICPEDYALAEDRGEVVEIFHSHCNSSPLPSEADLVVCEGTQLPWSIVSVPNKTWHEFLPAGYVAPLVGRTWAHGVLDCYSLIRDYYKRVLSIDIPDFDRDYEWWLKGDDLYLKNFASAGFYEVPIEDIKIHDVILMQILSPVINHGGLYVGQEKMLHHLHRRLSGRDVWGGYYRKHTVKVLRHHQCVQ